MRGSLLTSQDIDAYLAERHWSRETTFQRYRDYAAEFPAKLACRDETEAYTWAELNAATDRLAANLVALGLARDARALAQMPSS